LAILSQEPSREARKMPKEARKTESRGKANKKEEKKKEKAANIKWTSKYGTYGISYVSKH
jgi:hypothetical protein